MEWEMVAIPSDILRSALPFFCCFSTISFRTIDTDCNYSVPTNRTLKDLKLKGFSLAEGTVAGGFGTINELLEPLQEGVLKHCQGCDFWNADETTWRVFGSDKRKWWMWLIASQDAIVYILDPSRSKKIPREFFKGSVGILRPIASHRTKL